MNNFNTFSHALQLAQSHPENPPNCICPEEPPESSQAQQATFQSTWLAAYCNTLPPTRNLQFSHDMFLRHAKMCDQCREWVPSRLIIQDTQRAVTRADKELQTLATFCAGLARTHVSLESFIFCIQSGQL